MVLDRGQCGATIEAGGIVARKLALEREPCDVLLVVADAVCHVLEAPFGDEAEPPCGVALALQLFALAVLHHLALALAKLAQRLNVNTIIAEFLFHKYLLFSARLHYANSRRLFSISVI